jgi:glutathione S-transferase
MPLAPLPTIPEPFAAALRPEAELILYTHGTPNGWKVSVALEELGLDYSVVDVNITTGEQKKPWFVQINPNGRIPALHDRRVTTPAGGPLAIFESGAILLHLAEREGALLPADPVGRAETLSWLMFQMGGLGPMMGQANVFYRYTPEKIPYAIERYQRESRRLLSVMNDRLADRPFLVGEQYTIADIACWCWAHTHAWSGADVSGLDHLARWMAEIGARPAVQRGRAVPTVVVLPTEGSAAAKLAATGSSLLV